MHETLFNLITAVLVVVGSLGLLSSLAVAFDA